MVLHEFETLEGDELEISDLKGVSWKVVETMLDLHFEDGVTPVFTHRVEIHSIDDVTIAAIERCSIDGCDEPGVWFTKDGVRHCRTHGWE